MSDDKFEKFQALVAETLAVEKDKVTKEAKFTEDLEADSLDLTELVMALQDDFGVEIEDTEVESLETVGSAYDLVVSKL